MRPARRVAELGSLAVIARMDFFLLPLLLGGVLSFAACALRVGKKRRVSFWLALYVALVTGLFIVLFSFGFSLFTSAFWSGGKAPGGIQVSVVFGLSALVSFGVSFGVVLLYRGRQNV